MPINPAISLGVKPLEFQMPNALAQAGQIMQLRQAQSQIAEAEALAEERNKLRQLNPSAADYEQQLFRVNPQLGIQYRKERTAAESAEATRQKALTEAAAARQSLLSQAKRDISQRPSDANIMAYLEDIESSPLFNEAEKAQTRKNSEILLQMPFEQRSTYLASQGAKAGELQPVAVGNSLMTRQGQVIATAPRQSQLLTPEEESQKTRIALASRPPAQPVAPTITTVEDPTAPGKFLQVDARIYRGGGAGSPGVIGGARPSATAEKTAAQRQQLSKDLDTAIFELKDAAKEGGLIDQSTGSGVGRLVDVGARMVGQATPGDIAIAKLKPVADLVLKMVPRFEGPQSDKDTQSYKEAAGQLADPGMPIKIRKEAAKTIIRLMENRKGQFVSADMASEGTTPSGGVDASNPLLAK